MQATAEIKKVVRQYIDTASKSLAQLEQKAKEQFQQRYQAIGNTEAVKKLEQQFTKVATEVGSRLTPVQQKVRELSTKATNRAFATIGVATRADVESLSRKLGKLRSEVKKLAKAVAGKASAN